MSISWGNLPWIFMLRYSYIYWGVFLTSRIKNKVYNIFSMGIHSPIRKNLNLMSLIPWRIPLGMPSSTMISPSISRTLLGIGRVKTRSNFGRIYSNHPHIRIQIKVISSINQAKFCTGKNFHLRVQISQQNKKEKEWRKTRKDLYNVVVVERNTSL